MVFISANGERTYAIKMTLAQMQKFCGGYVECIAIGDNELWVNKDGKQKNLPVNVEATAIYRKAGNEGNILGNVILAPKEEIK